MAGQPTEQAARSFALNNEGWENNTRLKPRPKFLLVDGKINVPLQLISPRTDPVEVLDKVISATMPGHIFESILAGLNRHLTARREATALRMKQRWQNKRTRSRGTYPSGPGGSTSPCSPAELNRLLAQLILVVLFNARKMSDVYSDHIHQPDFILSKSRFFSLRGAFGRGIDLSDISYSFSSAWAASFTPGTFIVTDESLWKFVTKRSSSRNREAIFSIPRKPAGMGLLAYLLTSYHLGLPYCSTICLCTPTFRPSPTEAMFINIDTFLARVPIQRRWVFIGDSAFATASSLTTICSRGLLFSFSASEQHFPTLLQTAHNELEENEYRFLQKEEILCTAYQYCFSSPPASRSSRVRVSLTNLSNAYELSSEQTNNRSGSSSSSGSDSSSSSSSSGSSSGSGSGSSSGSGSGGSSSSGSGSGGSSGSGSGSGSGSSCNTNGVDNSSGPRRSRRRNTSSCGSSSGTGTSTGSDGSNNPVEGAVDDLFVDIARRLQSESLAVRRAFAKRLCPENPSGVEQLLHSREPKRQKRRALIPDSALLRSLSMYSHSEINVNNKSISAVDLSLMSNEQLKEICRTLHLTKSGAKADLAVRIWSCPSASTVAASHERMMHKERTAFKNSIVPVHHYKQYFNSVDRVDQHLAAIDSQIRFLTWEGRFLDRLFFLALLNARVLFADLYHQAGVPRPDTTIHSFVSIAMNVFLRRASSNSDF